MSTWMIHDVTAAAQTESTSVVQKKKTTITPFQKILDKENEVYATSEAQTEKTETAAKTSSVSKSRTTSSFKSGETTLQDIFERAAQKYDISYDFLVAVAKAESDFNTKCVSSAGAQGIMQVMP